MDYASGIRLPNCSKTALNQKNGNDVTICQHEVMVKFFRGCFLSLVNFSYWSKFYVNIITGLGVMTIFFIKGLTRNPEWCVLQRPNALLHLRTFQLLKYLKKVFCKFYIFYTIP